ncbi:hypothetical protein H5410_050393 [Solanum commersonii]|uniref:Uncharacterized protein n=1 Tax=Solanum commersonii TaxID=4109 RepID=A0A9J5WXU4_SOLCO|nr:hypothetical protein H5410_050393 [Solanum commersonii]
MERYVQNQKKGGPLHCVETWERNYTDNSIFILKPEGPDMLIWTLDKKGFGYPKYPCNLAFSSSQYSCKDGYIYLHPSLGRFCSIIPLKSFVSNFLEMNKIVS